MWKNYQGKYQSKILKKEMNFFYWEKKSTNKNCMSGANQKTRSSKKVEAVFFFLLRGNKTFFWTIQWTHHLIRKESCEW